MLKTLPSILRVVDQIPKQPFCDRAKPFIIHHFIFQQVPTMQRILAFLLLAVVTTTTLAASDSKSLPKVKIETSMGNIVVELYSDKAPKSVENFLKYVDAGYYDDTVFHRVIKDFMIQGGGFNSGYNKKKTRAPIVNEADNGLKNLKGTLAMARTSNPNSATAQFFVNVSDNPFLDHKSKTSNGWGYAVFAKVIEGMETAEKISQVRTAFGGPLPRKDVPVKAVILKKITRIKASESTSTKDKDK